MTLPARAQALVAGTVALGSGLIGFAVVSGVSAPLTTLAFLGAAVVLTELVQVSGDEDAPGSEDGFDFSFSSGFHIAAILLAGPWAAALVAALGVLAVDRVRGDHWPKVAFNACGFAIAAAAGGVAFQLLGGQPGSLLLPGDFVAVIALAAVYTTVNTVLVSTVVAFTAGAPAAEVVRESLRVEAASSAAEAGLGVAVAVCALEQPWAIAALVPLMAAVYLAHARLALLRRETARALETFANVVDERDPYTFRHSERVAGYVRELGEALGLPAAQVSRLAWAGRLHDLGKIAVDAAVLRKETRLDAAEWSAMRRHPRLSARLMRPFRFAQGETLAVEHHHERFDGQGYYAVTPGRIPLASHFIAVADSFDAMTTNRPYRAGLDRETALGEIERGAGSQFHPAVARAFVALRRREDPLAVLSPAEQAELRALTLRPARTRIGPVVRRNAPELAAASGTVGGLLALGASQPPVAVAAFGIAAVGLSLRAFELRRARKLAGAIREVFLQPRPRLTALGELAACLGAARRLAWIGLVRWSDDELDGSIELEWGDAGSRPAETALVSWLVRDGGGGDVIVSAGPELERAGAHVALRLRRRAATVGYLVVSFERPAPRHVELALAGSVPLLTHAFVDPPLTPVSPGVTRAAATG
jgi:HD-GYP domain-containing protein (c-di-GMP phosphodiesterase class II)